MRKSVLLSLFLFTTASAQQLGLYWNNDISTRAYFQTWSKEGDRVSQVSLPITYILSVSRNLHIDVTTGAAFAQRTTAQSKLNGFIDTRVRATFTTLGDRLLFSAFLTTPTGVSQLEEDQNEVASALADDALNFRVPNYGQGLRFNLAAVFAQKISDSFVVGLGAAFLFKESFEPFADRNLEYRPGNEVAVTFGVDIGGSKHKLAGDVSYISFQADEANGQEIFKSGNKLFVQLRWLLAPDPLGFTLYLQNRSKGKNERGIATLNEESLNSNGNQFDAGVTLSYRLSEKTTAKGLAETKFYSKNEYGDRGAAIVGLGAGLEYDFSRKVSFDGILRFLRGELKSRETETNITGFEIGGGLRFRL